MVLLKASQRHNSDLDFAAGWDKFKDFTLIPDENSGHFPLFCVTLHTLSLLAALLKKGYGAGIVEGIPTRNSHHQEQPSGLQPGTAELWGQ